MKILNFLAAADAKGLLEIKKAINSALEELNVETEEINLLLTGLPYFDGIKSETIKPIINSLTAADGVIFYINSYFSLPSPLLSTFFEHLSLAEYKDALTNKNCFIIVNTVNAPPAPVLNSVAAALNMLGAFDSVRLSADYNFTADFEPGSENRLMVERAAEDFYRMLRQQRKFYIGNYRAQAPSAAADVKPSQAPPKRQNPELEKIQKQEVEKIIGKVDDAKFNDVQQRDIQEITRLFAERFKSSENNKAGAEIKKEPAFAPLLPDLPKDTAPRNCYQLSASLAHFFIGTRAEGLEAKIQLSIAGDEEFECYYQIGGNTCEFRQGDCDKPDITIISSPGVWKDILKGKISAQKAFMTGQIKVRGNFVLLSRFDQIFDFNVV